MLPRADRKPALSARQDVAVNLWPTQEIQRLIGPFAPRG
jgi:hypothetical protein